ncbi:MAG TPA: LuxR C-terminal-related transcriptional regulator [Burkholderiales bacterium]|nr:LuxR C-terminal-related transcriptional regulator [Burkholderiales bacterium]
MAIDQTSRLLLELYRSARGSPIPEFQERALHLFKSLCRFHSAIWGVGEVSPDAGLAIHSVHLYNLSHEFFTEYEGVKEHDLVAFEAARRIGEVCNFNARDLMPEARYVEVARLDKRWGMQNLLVGTVLDHQPPGSLSFISLYRAKDQDRYTEDDRRCGEMFVPHLLEAGTINRLLWVNQLTSASAARGVRALASASGQLETRDPEFLDTLRKEWPDWSPPILPRMLIEALRSSKERRFMGKRITVAGSLEHGMLFLRATEKAPMERLTHAEMVVATLIAQGLSYKEAAKRRSLSPATVRNQLHSVYGKLGVNNKVALARRLNEYES